MLSKVLTGSHICFAVGMSKVLAGLHNCFVVGVSRDTTPDVVYNGPVLPLFIQHHILLPLFRTNISIYIIFLLVTVMWKLKTKGAYNFYIIHSPYTHL